MKMAAFDIAVIGGGPGGYVAAIRAAQLGKKVVLIERDKLGGICLNWGCIPTKALLRSAEVFSLFNHAGSFGLSAGETGYDFEKIVARSRKVAGQLSGGIGYLMKKNKITVMEGSASLKSANVITVTDSTGVPMEDIDADHIIIATGARAKVIPGMEPDDDLILDYRGALAGTTCPKSLLVVGSGAIGIEFASFFHSLGVDVHVVEIAERILPAEDHEISDMAKKALTGLGMKIHTKTTLGQVQKNDGQITATLKSADGAEESLTVDKMIVAVGITANCEGLGLEALGIELERGHIKTDEWCKTSLDHVYAIGDVTAPPWLAHKASHEAVLCVERIFGVEGAAPLNRKALPGCTYCQPQVASVGLTEWKAREMGYVVKVGKFPFQGNGKAIALGETQGMIKTVFDKNTGRLLGAHMIGAEVTELIQGFAMAISLKATDKQIAHVIFPHPTLSEMMHESVLAADNLALHI